MLYQGLICTFPNLTTRYVRRNEDYYMLTLKSSYIKHKTNIYSFFKKAAAITGAVVITACSFSACTPFGGSASRYNNADEQYNAADNESFNAFTDSLFRELASSDSLSLHALLENPCEYGIDDYDITLGRIDIDNIDRQLLRLLAQRQILVEKAGRLKPKGDKVAVQASDRVAQVIANRRKEALELGLSPDVAESVWRSMIKAFIALEEKVNKE